MKCVLVSSGHEREDGCRRHVCIRACKTNGHQKVLWVPAWAEVRDPGPCESWPFWWEWREWCLWILKAACFPVDAGRWLWFHLAPLPRLTLDGTGPGNELAMMLHRIRTGPIGPICNARRHQMNAWGPAGCREHREEILGWLRESYKRTPWQLKVMCGLQALARGLPLTLAGLLTLAIERAEGRA
jgi:hypothetical protein